MIRAQTNTIHYLDMIGGIAGDMFLAAAADLDPSIEGRCIEVAQAIAGLPDSVGLRFTDLRREGAFGTAFSVFQTASESTEDRYEAEKVPDEEHTHRHAPDHHRQGHGHHHHGPGIRHVGFREALEIVRESDVSQGTRERASDIFWILARAEGSAHGVDPEDVHFHEVGGWDSIIDIILAAEVIEHFGSSEWACGPVPLGRGSVEFSHGTLPVPAPATTEILRGFTVHQDEFPGERVTPTGAAILRHLGPRQHRGIPEGRLIGCGTGYGARTIEGLSNSLRLFRFEAGEPDPEIVTVIEFEVDDQSPEDLALGLEAIRAENGVLDVIQMPAYGKKGRITVCVRVLVEDQAREAVARACMTVTSSLGVRWSTANRLTLERSGAVLDIEGRAARVKVTYRPDGSVTEKIEADDLEHVAASYAQRQTLRHQAHRLTRPPARSEE